MDKIEKWLKGCLKKKAYKTRAFAEKMLPQAERAYKKKMQIYTCPDCFNYHLTSVKPKKI